MRNLRCVPEMRVDGDDHRRTQRLRFAGFKCLLCRVRLSLVMRLSEEGAELRKTRSFDHEKSPRAKGPVIRSRHRGAEDGVQIRFRRRGLGHEARVRRLACSERLKHDSVTAHRTLHSKDEDLWSKNQGGDNCDALWDETQCSLHKTS